MAPVRLLTTGIATAIFFISSAVSPNSHTESLEANQSAPNELQAEQSEIVGLEKKLLTVSEFNKTESDVFEDPTPSDLPTPFQSIVPTPHILSEFKNASDSWYGGRELLKSEGIGLSVTYTSDIAGNPIGGKTPGGCTYTDNIAFALLLETEKLWGWRGGFITTTVVQRDGVSLSAQNLGNTFPVQRTYGNETIHFCDLAYEQELYHRHANIKAGRIAMADDFATSPLYFLYMNKGIGSYPRSLFINGNISAIPYSVWGSRLKVDLSSSVIVRSGIYQVTSQSINGLNWGFYPGNGVMFASQCEWNPEFFKPPRLSTTAKENTTFNSNNPNLNPFNRSFDSLSSAPISTPKGLTGHYWMGGYYSTWEYSQFNTKIQAPNAYALYWHGDQMVYRATPFHDEGLLLWSCFTLSPQENISQIPLQINGGAIYTGLVPGRRDDFTILGVCYGDFSSSYAGVQEAKQQGNPTYELIYEFGYRVNLTRYAYIQPDLQWIIRPGGTGTVPNALVLGAQIGAAF